MTINHFAELDMSLTRNLLDASEDLSVEEDESCDRNDAGEDKSAPVLVISEHFGNLLGRCLCQKFTEYNQGSSSAL